MVDLSENRSAFPLFVKCLESLPNLHTLEVRWMRHSRTTSLRSALKEVKLPQIKTLTLPPAAYPLLRHCCNVEDVAWVVGRREKSSDGLLRSLASNPHLNAKRLAIPLTSQVDSSRKLSSALLYVGIYVYGVVMMTDSF